jgi:tetratricopeptide (TPR) repeat protein
VASRLIERLDLAIARCQVPLERECLKAERAGAMARHGRLADARFELAGVRSQSLRHRHPRLNAWVCMADGLIDHFESVGPQAQEKFRRAHSLAVSAGDQALRALAAGWLAMGSFNASDVPALAAHLQDGLTHAAPDHHGARARLGLVLADAFRFAGDDVQAQRWYLHARQHASIDGDSSMISVLLYNISALRSARIGLEDAFGQGDLDMAGKALVEADSTTNYDHGAGMLSLGSMRDIIRAQLLVVLGRHEEAIALFDQHLVQARAHGTGHREARFLADRAWCHLNMRRIAEALRDARMAEAAMPAQFDADDCAATHARLARIYAACEMLTEAAAHQARADDALAEHRAAQQQVLSAVQSAVQAAGIA